MVTSAIVRRQSLLSLGNATLGTRDVYSLQLLFNLAGYGYAICWGITFYPQVILNWRRKSTEGMSVIWQWYNLMGFLFYTIYTSFSDDSTVQDQLFAAHALLLTVLTLLQVRCYSSDKLGDFALFHAKMIAAVAILMDVALALKVVRLASWTTLVYTCGYLKNVMSVFKYMPQVYLNWQRRSTLGFAISLVFFDLGGGFLSILHQAVSCKYDNTSASLRDEWTWEPFTGNMPKLVLAIITLLFDSILLYQHYVLFGFSAHSQLPPAQAHISKCVEYLSKGTIDHAIVQKPEASKAANPQESDEQRMTTSIEH